MNSRSNTPERPRAFDSLGAEKGAYLILVELDRQFRFQHGGSEHRFSPGVYAYCGSAFGPGGLKARLARHIRKKKATHWHIDRLRQAGQIAGAYILPEGSECDLVAGLLKLEGAFVPLRGFGSSDCRTCPTHLVGLPKRGEMSAFPGLVRLELEDPE